MILCLYSGYPILPCVVNMYTCFTFPPERDYVLFIFGIPLVTNRSPCLLSSGKGLGLTLMSVVENLLLRNAVTDCRFSTELRFHRGFLF